MLTRSSSGRLVMGEALAYRQEVPLRMQDQLQDEGLEEAQKPASRRPWKTMKVLDLVILVLQKTSKMACYDRRTTTQAQRRLKRHQRLAHDLPNIQLSGQRN